MLMPKKQRRELAMNKRILMFSAMLIFFLGASAQQIKGKIVAEIGAVKGANLSVAATVLAQSD